MPALESTRTEPRALRPRALVASLLMCLVIGVAVVVGLYAMGNPNGVRFSAPWPVLAEVLAAAAVITLGFVGHARPGRGGWALFAAGVVLAILAVAALGWVGFALSVNAH